MKTFSAVIALALLVAFAPGCITDPVTGNKVLGASWSKEEEIALGAQYAPTFKAQYEGRYPDQELQSHCEKIVLHLAEVSHRPDLPWNFTILNSSEVNAFALPGGTVCITRGLLWRLDTEAEFAAVMGHEIGHVNHKHAAQGQGRQTLAQIGIAGLAVGAAYADSDWATYGLSAAAVGAQLTLLYYSRDQEREADDRGVEYSYKAGYDPRELAGVFEVFKELKKGNEAPFFLSTHPLDDDRIRDVLKEVDEKYPQVAANDGAGLKRNTPEWERLIARLRKDQKVYEQYDQAGQLMVEALKSGNRAQLTQALRSVEDCERRLPGHALFPSAHGVVLYIEGEKNGAKGKFQQAAKLQDDLFEPHLYLGRIAFEQSDQNTALAELRKAGELYPMHPQPYYFQAIIFDRRGDRNAAANGYKAVMERASEQSQEYQYSKKRLSEMGLMQ